MIVAAILIPALGAAILALATVNVADARERGRIMQIQIAAYGLRLILFEAVMRRVAFFSHGVAGGDCLAYQANGSLIAQLWRYGHVHFVTEHEMPQLGQAVLPCNLLGLFEYIGGEPAPLAGTTVNAFFACWTTLLIYRFIRDAGADARIAERVMLLVLFGPSFLYHTSDTYKDGLNAFLVIASVLNSVRLAQNFNPARLGYLALSLFFLWFVRHYMVFMCLAPLSIGFLGVGKASLPRRLAAGAFMLAVCAALFYTGQGVRALDSAAETYNRATSANVLLYNAGARSPSAQTVGSGVVTSNYFEALVYTVFAPFPWQFGSFGLQLGKIEALISYWFMYTVYRNRRKLWAEHRLVVMMLASFIIPATLAYATTFANVGLMVRQRMPIVIAMAILAGLAATAHASVPQPAPQPAPPSPVRRRVGAT